jgi:MraZ protein
MYLGLYATIVTNKNQLTFPSKLLAKAEKNFIVTHWFEKSLVVLPQSDAAQILQEVIKEATPLLPESRDLARFFFVNAAQVKLDSKNRFVLPKELKDYAQIGSEAVFLGVNERIELWDKKIYQNYGAIREAQIRETAIQHYNRIKQLNQKKDE